MGGHYGKTALRQFSLIAFPPDLGGKKLWAQGENFLPGFPLPLFSSYSQTEENSVFHSIFLLTFSIPPKMHPTKHSASVYEGTRLKSAVTIRSGEVEYGVYILVFVY